MTCSACGFDAWVFVSGPYTHPDPVVNTRAAIDAGETLVAAGYVVIVPHLSLFTHLLHPHNVDYWYEYDVRLMRRCDLVLRLLGLSNGAEGEAAAAETMSLPVFFGTAEEFVASHRSCMRCGAELLALRAQG